MSEHFRSRSEPYQRPTPQLLFETSRHNDEGQENCSLPSGCGSPSPTRCLHQLNTSGRETKGSNRYLQTFHRDNETKEFHHSGAGS